MNRWFLVWERFQKRPRAMSFWKKPESCTKQMRRVCFGIDCNYAFVVKASSRQMRWFVLMGVSQIISKNEIICEGLVKTKEAF